MTFSLDRIDAAPINNSDFEFPFQQWLGVLVDTLNEIGSNVEQGFNFLAAPKYKAEEIAALTGLPDGSILYDTDNNEYVGKISGTLVKFTTAAYP